VGVAARQLDFKEARKLSVQEKPDAPKGESQLYGLTMTRGPLLPAPGTRERQWALRQYWYNDYNELFRGAAAGAVKSLQSTTPQIEADDPEPWMNMLMAADFGNWDRFLSKTAINFLRYDCGGFVELIAPGNPMKAPTGPVVGLACLDPLRCWPTGDPDYPVIYYNARQQMHIMHYTRVVQYADDEDSEELLMGYGDCALARAIGTVHRDILMNQYLEGKLDDKPHPGLMILGNISRAEFNLATQEMREKQQTDQRDDWGRITILQGAQAEVKPTAESITFTEPPEKFDWKEYTEINVKRLALALNVDILELWELTRGGLGAAGQSEAMQQKSAGKLPGRLRKGIERIINQALPPDVEFSWEYKDPREEQEEADNASKWATVITTLGSDLSAQERRELAARKIEAVKDTLEDPDGTIRELPKGEDDTADGTDYDEISQPATADDTQTVMVSAGQKDFAGTARDFESAFAAFIRTAQQGGSAGALRAVFRDELHDAGMDAYEDGLRAGGVDPNEADAVTKADRRRRVAEWLAVQDTYIRNLVDDVRGREEPVSDKEIALRAQMWANKSLHSIYYAGLFEASKNKLYQWQYSEEKDHCATCLSLNGQVHSLRTWMKSGFTPKCTCLECGGYLCGCEFVEPTTGPRGRIPGRGGLRTAVDRIGDFVRHVATRKDFVDVPDIKPQWDNHTAALAGFMRYVGEGA
jgi:hypothetical protein